MKLLDRSLLLTLATLIATLGAAGCRSDGGGDDDDTTDGDADADTDADTDGDADADTDADADADTDADADADSDADGDADCSTENTDELCSDQQDNNDNGFTDCTDFCCSREAAVTICTQEATVQDVRQGEVAEDTIVRLQHMIVTAVEGTSWYMQDSLAVEPEFSGIYAYVPNTNPGGITIPAVGDIITVEGEYSEFYDMSELSYLREPVVEPPGELPAPVFVTPIEIGDESGVPERGEALESVLVATNGYVTSLEPAAGQGDDEPTNEFAIGEQEGPSLLRVDDRMYSELFSSVQVGDQVSIVGVLRFGNEHFKLEPRQESDVEVNPQ